MLIHFLKKEFKELTKKELYAILKLRMEIFVLEQRSFYLDLDDQDQDAMHIFGAETDHSSPVCYGRVTIKHSTAYIRRICVQSAFRQSGLGTLLMKEILLYTDSLTIETLELDAQTHLQAFYRKYGFHPVGEPYDDSGIPHIMMRKNIYD